MRLWNRIGLQCNDEQDETGEPNNHVGFASMILRNLFSRDENHDVDDKEDEPYHRLDHLEDKILDDAEAMFCEGDDLENVQDDAFDTDYE